MKKITKHRKATYEINPAKRSLDKAYNSLSLIDRSIYAFLMDLCWMGETQYMIKIDETSWAEMLHVEESVVVNFISNVVKEVDGFKLAEESFDLTTSSFQLIFLDLKEQIENYNAWAIKEEELTRKKNMLERKSLNLLDIASDRDTVLMGVTHYVEPSQRNLDVYLGWLPTVGFDTTGQVYRMRDFVIKNLKEEYPTLNIEEEIVKMFNWFANPKNRRRTTAQMNTFIHNWLERAQNGWEDHSKKEFNLESELDKLIDFEIGQAVNG